MLAGLYINEFWGALLIMTMAVGPVVAMMTLVDWLYRLDDARLEAVRQREAAARKPAASRHARDAASSGTYSDRFEKAAPKPSSGPSQQPTPKPTAATPHFETGQQKAPAPGINPCDIARTTRPGYEASYKIRRSKHWRAQRDVVLGWFAVAGFGWYEWARNLEKARGVEAALLRLSLCELAIIICRHGLITGHRLSHEQTAALLGMKTPGVKHSETRAVLKIDRFQIIADRNLNDFEWSYRFLYWYDWRAEEAFRIRRARPKPSTGERKAARLRVEVLLAFYRTARSIAAPSAADTLFANWLCEDTAAGTRHRFIAANGAIKRSRAAERSWRDIDAVETSIEAHTWLARLAPEARRVISLAFGIGQQGEHTTKEIAMLMGLDPLTTKQIEMTALARLRQEAAAQQTRRLS